MSETPLHGSCSENSEMSGSTKRSGHTCSATPSGGSTPNRVVSKIPRQLPVGPCGLRNLGNTCYMNSVLQCLAHTTPLREIFTRREGARPYEEHIKNGEIINPPPYYETTGACPGPSVPRPYEEHINRSNPDGTDGVLAEVYGALMEKMCSGTDIIVQLGLLKDVIGQYAPRFAGYSQQDAQELLTFLLDGLHEDLNRVQGEKPYVDMTVDGTTSDKEIAEETWKKHCERNNSPIVDIFQGLIRHRVVCPKCKEVTRTFEPVMQLTIPVTATPLHWYQVGYFRDPTSLKDLLEEFTAVKETDECNWICNKCNEQDKPWRIADVWKTPPILIIHLKRFKTSRWGHTKLHVPVEFPYKLDFMGKMTDNVEQKNVLYELYAVINHSGLLFSGHYTAFVKLADSWYHCDDGRVGKVDKSELWSPYATVTVYMLFYKLVVITP